MLILKVHVDIQIWSVCVVSACDQLPHHKSQWVCFLVVHMYFITTILIQCLQTAKSTWTAFHYSPAMHQVYLHDVQDTCNCDGVCVCCVCTCCVYMLCVCALCVWSSSLQIPVCLVIHDFKVDRYILKDSNGYYLTPSCKHYCWLYCKGYYVCLSVYDSSYIMYCKHQTASVHYRCSGLGGERLVFPPAIHEYIKQIHSGWSNNANCYQICLWSCERPGLLASSAVTHSTSFLSPLPFNAICPSLLR